MASDEFCDGTTNSYDWRSLKAHKNLPDCVWKVSLIETSIEMTKETLEIQESFTTDKSVHIRLRNDIAYKYQQIEAIRAKYPEYFI